MTAASFASRLETQRALLTELSAINQGRLALVQRTDYKFLEGILRANVAEESQIQRWRQDPRLYVQTEGITFKLVGDHRPPDERGEALVRDLQTLQARLVNAKINLTQFMPRWLPYANARIDGTILHFRSALTDFANRLSPRSRSSSCARLPPRWPR